MNLFPDNIAEFAGRHLGPKENDQKEMLKTVAAENLEELISQVLPEGIRRKSEMKLPDAWGEAEFLKKCRKLGKKNIPGRSFIGMGYHGCHTPAVIRRNVLENPGWYTQYTPYQAEISQGRLEVLLVFQTMVSDLTGLEVANSSLLDEATAAAEAMLMLRTSAMRLPAKKNANKFFVAQNCHPQTLDVIKTRAEALGIELQIEDPESVTLGDDVFGALLQNPCTEGVVRDWSKWIAEAKKKSISTVMACEPLSLMLLKSPGEMGADVAVGSTQRFGMPMGFGGPHAAFFATRDKYKRMVPGRIIGATRDRSGKTAFRMALQTREQHIRREKATSNICTAQVLPAIISAFYAVYHGPEGLKRIATRVHGLTRLTGDVLKHLGYTILKGDYFDTIKISLGKVSGIDHRQLQRDAEDKKLHFRYFPDGDIGISLDETTTLNDVFQILSIFAQAAGAKVPYKPDLEITWKSREFEWAENLIRKDQIFTHSVFGGYHSETEMMRFIKRLESRDLSLAQSMIPLGSCTMKLNAAAEMEPVTWPEWADMHPFAPLNTAKGYVKLIEELEEYLAEITGLPGVSLEPNAGSQGEYAGLLTIMAFHRDRDRGNKNIVLIPTSAHGTNPASAAMAGMKVKLVACDEQGNIDVEDLRKKAEEESENLAALMITYPSTHGVFEEKVKEVVDIVHQHKALVYMDGANMNAQVGYCSPGELGVDVCHLNLHKTFCIPHGGGGPGMGPICVSERLTPFLPSHPLVKVGGERGITSVSAAPWGSPLILPISWGYIRMMGSEGLKQATALAILNANYLTQRLKDHYPVLYSGKNGRVAHEMILDCRHFRDSAGISVEDIAKRLMDYGFHAPTVSFPVAGTLMVEPTESESKAELDRFCDAMISIREEITNIETGKWPEQDNPLVNAPHTASEVMADKWEHPYSREVAAFPLTWSRESKFWPAVSRVDNAFGDRNLICACPSIEEYAE